MTLKELAGRGWIRAEPPEMGADESVVAVVDGTEIKAGFERKNSPIVDSPERIHRIFRSGQYDLEVKLETAGDMAFEGFVKVERAEGYEP